MGAAVLDLSDCHVIQLFAALWKSHALGETENGAWITLNEDGQYRAINWAFTPLRHSTVWSGVLPPKIVAQLHTHGENLDPKPSGQDSLVARQLNVCVYTVTRKGIWKVSPEGVITREMNHNWVHESARRCGAD
jgi:hypothetical protein